MGTVEDFSWRLSDDKRYLGKSAFAVTEMKQKWHVTVYYKCTVHGTYTNNIRHRLTEALAPVPFYSIPDRKEREEFEHFIW